MKEKITLLVVGVGAVFAPVEVCALLLMFVIFIDTIVKLISLKKIACIENKKYRDVFKSKILRRGYIFKAAGYYIFAGALFPLDYYALTPFSNGLIHALGYEIILPTAALYTNLLLCLFALIELASINENWFDITGNNMLKAVFNVVKKIRGTVEKISDTYKNIKN
jgi:hypothetical protein|tara:strand:+ start:786 stop:1283 length:498 start_codon:yes stop_codon:yes gene_type:complete